MRSLSFPFWTSPAQADMVLFSFFFFIFFSWKELSSQLFDFDLVCPQCFCLLTSDPYQSSLCTPCIGSASLSGDWICRAFAADQAYNLSGSFLTQFPSSAGEQCLALWVGHLYPFSLLFFLKRIAPDLHGWQLCCPSEVTFSAGLAIFVHKLLESASCHRVTRLQTPGCSKLVFNTSDRLFRCFTQLLPPSLRCFWNALPTESEIL